MKSQASLGAAHGLSADNDPAALSGKSVFVYEAPVRLWHWVNALAIFTLALTGYFIGSPLPTQPGEASASFLMGYIRFAHFSAGYVLAIGLVGRLYWAIVGNHHARQLFTLPLLNGAWWREVWEELSWYLLIRKLPHKYFGHNPLAQFAMFTLYFLTTLFMICTGFALYGEGAQHGSWADRVFGWVIPLLGQSQGVHTWHHLGMWVLITFVIIHVYAALREDAMSRQSILSSMIGGSRTFKD
jgi:Ni/Fe-hydrogenase 1 B-type cytochrome subunit